VCHVCLLTSSRERLSWDRVAEISRKAAKALSSKLKSGPLGVCPLCAFAPSRETVSESRISRKEAKSQRFENENANKRLTQTSSFHSRGEVPEIRGSPALPSRRPVVLLPSHL